MDSAKLESLRLVGAAVRHRSFGSGVIEGLNRDVLTVSFSQGRKKFIFPDAFEQFLRVEDKDVNSELERFLARRRGKAQAKRQELHRRDQLRRRIREMKVLPASHAAFDLNAEQVRECLEKGSVPTGVYLSGYSKGSPRLAVRINPNSLCFLTALPKGSPESERRVLGAFMAAGDFFGQQSQAGLVRAHERYILAVGPDKAPRLWDFFAPEERPERFGRVPFRYLDVNGAGRLLEELLKECRGEKAEEFMAYFKKLNKI